LRAERGGRDRRIRVSVSSTGAAEHEQITRKRICIQLLPAQLGQRVDALPEIDRLHRHQNPHLRRDLNHPSVSRQTRSRLAQSGGTAVFHSMRIFAPLEDSNSMTHSSSGAEGGVISSTNADLGKPFLQPPYNPAVAAARRNRLHVAGPVRPQPATATPAALSAAAGCCETDPTGVATARSARVWVVWLCRSYLGAPPGDLMNLTERATSRHARLPETHLLLTLQSSE
jgi:hypothetical protein